MRLSTFAVSAIVALYGAVGCSSDDTGSDYTSGGDTAGGGGDGTSGGDNGSGGDAAGGDSGGPAGCRVAFTNNRTVNSTSNFRVFVGPADTPQTEVAITDDGGREWEPQWKPDGSKITFASDRDGGKNIFIANPDGSGMSNLTNSTSTNDEHRWAPDGSKIFFTSFRDGDMEIYSMNPDGSAPTNISATPTTFDQNAIVSPSGTTIAFESRRDGQWEIYTMGTDGSAQTRLTNDADDDRYISWSPDSAKIAFMRDDDLWVMDADGGNAVALVISTNAIATPSWSPDGLQIAYMQDGNFDRAQVYVMDADGANPTAMTDETFSNYYFVHWRPNGLQILAGAGAMDGSTNMSLIETDGSGTVLLNVSGSAKTASDPAWSPDCWTTP